MSLQKIRSETQFKNTDITGAELEELSDGSTTTLHVHAGGGDVFLIEHKEASAGDVADFTFSSIPGGYRHLEWRYCLRSDLNATGEWVYAQINGDTGNNYNTSIFYSNSTTPAAVANTLNTDHVLCTTVAAATGPADTFDTGIIWLNNYLNTHCHKQLHTRGIDFQTNTGPGIYIMDGFGKWANTNAVTAVKFYTGHAGQKWKRYSTFDLYGYK